MKFVLTVELVDAKPDGLFRKKLNIKNVKSRKLLPECNYSQKTKTEAKFSIPNIFNLNQQLCLFTFLTKTAGSRLTALKHSLKYVIYLLKRLRTFFYE